MDRVQNWGVDYSLLAEVLFDFSGRCYELYNEDHFLTELLVDLCTGDSKIHLKRMFIFVVFLEKLNNVWHFSSTAQKYPSCPRPTISAGCS